MEEEVTAVVEVVVSTVAEAEEGSTVVEAASMEAVAADFMAVVEVSAQAEAFTVGVRAERIEAEQAVSTRAEHIAAEPLERIAAVRVAIAAVPTDLLTSVVVVMPAVIAVAPLPE